jgi:hypothetical protein
MDARVTSQLTSQTPSTSQPEPIPTASGREVPANFSPTRFKLIARRVAVSTRVPSAQPKNIKFEPSPSSSQGGCTPLFSYGSPKYFIEKHWESGSRWCSRVNVSGPPEQARRNFGLCLNPVLPLIPSEVNLDKEAKGTDALRGIAIPRISKSPVLFRVLRRWYWNSALRVLLTELNNLPSRMRWALQIHAWELGGYRGQPPTQLSVTANSQCRICRPVYIFIHATTIEPSTD